MPFTIVIEEARVPTGRETSRLFQQLHQTAQPLAVLQGILELSLVDSRTVEDYRSAAELALAEARRVADRFKELRRLIQHEATPDQNFGENHV